MGKHKVLSKQEADEKCELIYIESAKGFHFAIDFTFIEQVGDFKIELPTGEIINTEDLDI